MLLVGVAIVLAGAGFAWVASRDATPPGGSTVVVPPVTQPVQPPPQPLIAPGSNSNSEPVNVGPIGGGKGGGEIGGNDLLNLAGKVGGALAGGSAFTNTAKYAAAPIGVGVATVAILAGAGASLSVAAIWVAPIICITVAIVTIVDGIARTAQNERWKELCIQVRDLRAAGQIQEAFAVYDGAVGSIAIDPTGARVRQADGSISEISRQWPRPGESWYNTADIYGRPYPGFPGPPAPASVAELKLNPALMPESLPTVSGHQINVRQLLAAALKDVNDIRAWGLANGVPGELPAWGEQENNKSATSETRPLLMATTGPRDISKWQPLLDRQRRLISIRASLASAIPWLSEGCFITGPANTLEELAVMEFRAGARTKETGRRALISARRNFGGSPAAALAAAAAMKNEAAAEARETTAARASNGAPAPRANSGGATSGGGTGRSGNADSGGDGRDAAATGRRAENLSGSGGRNA